MVQSKETIEILSVEKWIWYYTGSELILKQMKRTSKNQFSIGFP